MSGVSVTPVAGGSRPTPPPAPSTFGETMGAAWRLSLDDDEAGNENNRIQAYNGVEDALVGLGYDRKRYQNPAWNTFLTTTETAPERRNALWADLQAARAKDPKHFAEIPKTQAEFDRYAYARQGKRALDMGVVENGSGTASTVAGLGFGILQSGQPQNLPSIVMGGAAKTIPQILARGFLTNSMAAAAQTMETAQSRANMGETYTADEALQDTVIQGSIGAVLDVGIHVGGKAVAALPSLSPERKIARALGRENLSDVTDREVATHFSQTVPGNVRTPDEIAAVHVMERQADVDGSNPFVDSAVGLDSHAAKLQAAIDAVTNAGRDGLVLDNGTPVVTLRGTLPAASRGGGMSQSDTIRFTMHDLEGGATVVHFSAADGGTTKYGIAATHNPGVDVANLTEGQAADIARRKYWFKELDGVSPDTAAIGFDAGYIAGPAVGRRILRESGGDPARAIELYRAYLNNLADTVPGKAKFRKGWNNRVDKLARKIGAPGGETGAPGGIIDVDGTVRSPDLDAERPEMFGAGERSAFDLDQHSAEVPQLRRELYASDADHALAQGTAERDALGLEHPVIAEPEARAAPTFTPETRTAVQAYAADPARGPIDAERIATQLGVSIDEARAALADVTAKTNALTQRTIYADVLDASGKPVMVKAGNGRMVKSRGIKSVELIRARNFDESDMLSWLASKGGVRNDEGHDLRNRVKRMTAGGSVISAKGMPIDKAREAAAEAGFFHGMTPDEAMSNTTVADFLALLEQASTKAHPAEKNIGAFADRDGGSANAELHARVNDEADFFVKDSGITLDADARAELVERFHSYNPKGPDDAEAWNSALNDLLGAHENEIRAWAIENDPNYGKDPWDDGFDTTATTPVSGNRYTDADRAAANGEAGGAKSPDDRGAADDDAQAQRPTPPDLKSLEAFDDPVGPAAKAVADSIEHDLKAELKSAAAEPARSTVPQSVAADDGLGPSSILSFVPKTGKPGLSVINEEGHFLTAVFRDADGKPVGAVRVPTSAEGRDLAEAVSSYVRPEFRRQGIGTQLYDALKAEGHDIDAASGSGDLTPDGAAFVNARRQPKLDSGAAVDPAIADRARQQAALKADAPLRSTAEQDGTMGSPLFDAVDQATFRLEDGSDRTIADVLAGFDAEDAAHAAARACL